MKLYAKKDTAYISEHGIIIDKEGEIINLPRRVIDQLNRLETEYQRASWSESCSEYTPVEEFKRKSIFDGCLPSWVAMTPELDSEVERSAKLYNEKLAVETVKDMNAMVQEFSDLVYFINSQTFVGDDFGPVVRIDTPMLGDPLKLTSKDFGDVIAKIHGYHEEDKED